MAGIAVLACSCHFVLDPDDYTDRSSASDGGPDGDIDIGDLADACKDNPPALFDRKLFLQSKGPLTLDQLGMYTLSTSNPPHLLAPDGKEITVHLEQTASSELILVVHSLTITEDATLRAEGTRSLIIASASDITIDGAISVESSNSTNADPGAGANSSACGSSSGVGSELAPSVTLGGGGGGGALGGPGGGGGDGSESGGLAGTVAPTFSRPQGGCSGGNGGSNDDSFADGGAGGGAVHLLACKNIVMREAILASGAGGKGGPAGLRGGGGGGSGGYIGFDAPTVEFMLPSTIARFTANGGGGGGGSSAALKGMDGGGGLPSNMVAGLGGRGGGVSLTDGKGGDGQFIGSPTSSGQPGTAGTTNGAGGGGGGVGIIWIQRGNTDALDPVWFSPAPVCGANRDPCFP